MEMLICWLKYLVKALNIANICKRLLVFPQKQPKEGLFGLNKR